MSAPSALGRRGSPRAPRTLCASTELDVSAGSVFAFLADLRNHWKLADRWIEVESLHIEAEGQATGGVVRIRGPLGLHRTARIRIVPASAPGSIEGWASVGRRTHAHVRWEIEAAARGSQVALSVEILRAGLPDRVLLALGGGHWMRGRLRSTLRALAETPHASG